MQNDMVLLHNVIFYSKVIMLIISTYCIYIYHQKICTLLSNNLIIVITVSNNLRIIFNILFVFK